MNTKKIKEVADVIAGYTFRVALEAHTDGLMAVIQSKDVLDDLYINQRNLAKIDLQEYNTKAIIEEDDIVISSRGNFKASVVKGNLTNMIASSSVYVLRIQDKNILPEYLAIYLNSIEGQKKIQKKVTGSVIKTILRRDLENLQIPMLGIGMQNKVINLYKNNKAQQQLLNRKKVLTNQIIESSILDFLK